MIGEFWPQSGLVGLWHLNGNANDSSGNSLNGTPTNITFSAANGKFTQGAGYNGTSSIIAVAHNAALSITANLSIGFWMNWNGTNGGKMVAKANAAAATNYCCYNNPTGNLGKLAFYQGTEYISTYTCPTNTWIYVFYTISGTTLKIYVNGAEVYSTTIGSLSSNTGSLCFGQLGDYSADGTTYGGKLDEIVIFNKTLTPQEIRKLYAWSKGKFASLSN